MFPLGGGVPGAIIGGKLGSAAGNAIGEWLNDAIFSQNLSSAEERQKAQERKEYSRICKSPIPPSGDACKDAKANRDRLQQCLQLRESFSNKWYKDSDPGHMSEIANTRTAVAKLDKFIRENCSASCN